MSTGITAQIADWAIQTRFEDLPRRVVEEAKNQILSVIAAVHAGHFSEAGRVVSKTVREWGGAKEATMIPSGERVSLHNAIYANAALSMSLDYDDYLFAGHTGHSAVLVTLGLAEHVGFSGKDFLLAQVLANEVGGRLGALAFGGPLNGQMWSFIHLANGALITAKVLGLDAAQIQSAVGVALAQPNFPLRAGFFGSEAKALLAATTAVGGVQAAQLVANGMRGVVDVLEAGDDGFERIFAPQALRGAWSGFGKTWLTDTLSYKLYPGCAYVDTAIDCVLSLQRQHSIDGRKIKGVHIAASPLTVGMEAMSTPYLRGADSLPVTLNFSVGYSVAAALLDKELTARQFLRERVKDPSTWDLAKRVTVTVDDGMSQRMRDRMPVRVVSTAQGDRYEVDLNNVDLSACKMSFGARVRIDLDDGRSFEAEQEVPFGAAGRPFDDRRKSVEDKFRRETRYTLRKEKMERAIDMILHLDQMNSAQLRELTRTCCSERG
jgi:2-methylcitrate dehydratase PrpD